eukprot:CAMPEP_0194419698 /NCGR_PEP_ID=MMETSP0176-20130528/18864_1 /TAXON_ID=216777 /ORGANISM="Proboscia alata, Strain PI-D3" /LENGTH=168 /DNA_ID=CAMNT_0039226809 /DNA_START=37 /DNA_END=539 /DNA_ORIENTATION=-
MGRFTGTLHILCEEARWSEINSILRAGSKPKHTKDDDGISATSTTVTNTTHDLEKDDVSGNAPDAQAVAKTTLTLFQTECVEKQGFNEWTPLMISCVRAPPTLIRGLVRLNPASTRITDRSGSLPLHFVCCWRRPSRTTSGTGVSSSLSATNVTAQDNISTVLTVLLR